MWKIPKSVWAIYAQVAENRKTIKKNSELDTEKKREDHPDWFVFRNAFLSEIPN